MTMRRFCLTLILFLGLGLPAFAADGTSAQAVVRDDAPVLPKPLMEQRARGAQVFYLGKYDNLDGWMMIRAGQPEFYYATPGNKALVMGFLFDSTGNLITGTQIRALRGESETGIAPNILGSGALPTQPNATPQSATPADNVSISPTMPASTARKPSDFLWEEVTTASSVLLGKKHTPVFYALLDPNCHFCQLFLQDVAPAVEAGQVSVQIVPLGYDEKSVQQAAFVLAGADGAKRMLAYAQGNADMLPATGDMDATAVNNNTSLIEKWNFAGTPVIIYRAGGTGEVKIIQGRPADLPSVIQDLTKGQ